MNAPYKLLATLPLARSAVDRSTSRRADATWLDAAWSRPDSQVLLVGEGKVAVEGSSLVLVRPDSAPGGERYFLGEDDGRSYFAVHTANVPDGAATLRDVGTELTDRDAGLAVHAISLANWHDTHRFCPRCGDETRPDEGGHLRRCVADGSEHFPRTDPAVIVLVTDEHDRCLLGSSQSPPGNRFSTLAGFVEPGETPEHAVAREVMEEASVAVTGCRYAGAQPWPFPHNLMLGFYGTGKGADPVPDGDEVLDAGWFTRDDVKTLIERGQIRIEGNVSIARRLLEGWLYSA